VLQRCFFKYTCFALELSISAIQGMSCTKG